jgi:hypothetical protein
LTPPLPTPTAPVEGDNAGVPLGAKSVLDAGAPKYVPVPVVTLPDYRHAPQPPAPQMPKPPEPNYADVNNAFTNPAANPPPATPPQAANAFSPPPQADQPAMPSGAFGNVPQGYPAGGMPGMMPAGYAGYGRPGMMPPAMGRPMAPPMPGPGMNQAMYQPNAMMGQPVRPAAYLPPAGPAQAPMAGAPAPHQEAMPSLSSTMSPAEAQATLRDSLYPSQREWAAGRLGGLDWRTNGDAVQALVVAARQDPAPSVRAACVRTLAHMRVNTVPVVRAIQALKADGDPRVLHEVEEALAVLAPESSAPAGHGVQPASAVMPMYR